MPPNLYNFGRIVWDDRFWRDKLIAGYGRERRREDGTSSPPRFTDYTPTDWEIDRYKYDTMKARLRKYEYDQVRDDFQTLGARVTVQPPRGINLTDHVPYLNTQHFEGPEFWRRLGRHLIGIMFDEGYGTLLGFVMQTENAPDPREPHGSLKAFIPYLDVPLNHVIRAHYEQYTNHYTNPLTVKHLLGVGRITNNREAWVNDRIDTHPGIPSWNLEDTFDYGVVVNIPYHIIRNIVPWHTFKQGQAGVNLTIDGPEDEPMSLF